MGLCLGLLRWRYAFTDAELAVIVATAFPVAQLLVLAPLQHSHVPLHFGLLDRIVYSPSLHQVHHSSKPQHWDRNFGSCLSVWDSLFGTYQRLGGETVSLGLTQDEHKLYVSLLSCYLRPFTRTYRMMTGRADAPSAEPASTDEKPQAVWLVGEPGAPS